MIAIVDYGMGNLGSIFNMFKKIGVESEVTSDVEKIRKAPKVLLPGVGAFDNAMKCINSQEGLREVLDYKALEEKVPVLGICLGMQLLTNGSEEGTLPGLGWIPAQTIGFKFPKEQKMRVPHMGWNTVNVNTASPLTEGFDEEFRFYFVHSYYVKADQNENSILKTEYGHPFDSALQNDNIFGAQFHPEKSHKFGMHLLRNFSKI